MPFLVIALIVFFNFSTAVAEITEKSNDMASHDEVDAYQAWRKLKTLSRHGNDSKRVACFMTASSGGVMALGAAATIYSLDQFREDKSENFKKTDKKLKALSKRRHRIFKKIDDLFEAELRQVSVREARRRQRRRSSKVAAITRKMKTSIKSEHIKVRKELQKKRQESLAQQRIEKAPQKAKVAQTRKELLEVTEELNKILAEKGHSLGRYRQFLNSKLGRESVRAIEELKKLKAIPYIGPILAGAFFAADSYSHGVQAASKQMAHDSLGIKTLADSSIGPKYVSSSYDLQELLKMEESSAFSAIGSSPVLRKALPKMLQDYNAFGRYSRKLNYNDSCSNKSS